MEKWTPLGARCFVVRTCGKEHRTTAPSHCPRGAAAISQSQRQTSSRLGPFSLSPVNLLISRYYSSFYAESPLAWSQQIKSSAVYWIVGLWRSCGAFFFFCLSTILPVGLSFSGAVIGIFTCLMPVASLTRHVETKCLGPSVRQTKWCCALNCLLHFTAFLFSGRKNWWNTKSFSFNCLQAKERRAEFRLKEHILVNVHIQVVDVRMRHLKLLPAEIEHGPVQRLKRFKCIKNN